MSVEDTILNGYNCCSHVVAGDERRSGCIRIILLQEKEGVIAGYLTTPKSLATRRTGTYFLAAASLVVAQVDRWAGRARLICRQIRAQYELIIFASAVAGAIVFTAIWTPPWCVGIRVVPGEVFLSALATSWCSIAAAAAVV